MGVNYQMFITWLVNTVTKIFLLLTPTEILGLWDPHIILVSKIVHYAIVYEYNKDIYFYRAMWTMIVCFHSCLFLIFVKQEINQKNIIE